MKTFRNPLSEEDYLDHDVVALDYDTNAPYLKEKSRAQHRVNIGAAFLRKGFKALVQQYSEDRLEDQLLRYSNAVLDVEMTVRHFVAAKLLHNLVWRLTSNTKFNERLVEVRGGIGWVKQTGADLSGWTTAPVPTCQRAMRFLQDNHYIFKVCFNHNNAHTNFARPNWLKLEAVYMRASDDPSKWEAIHEKLKLLWGDEYCALIARARVLELEMSHLRWNLLDALAALPEAWTVVEPLGVLNLAKKPVNIKLLEARKMAAKCLSRGLRLPKNRKSPKLKKAFKNTVKEYKRSYNRPEWTEQLWEALPLEDPLAEVLEKAEKEWTDLEMSPGGRERDRARGFAKFIKAFEQVRTALSACAQNDRVQTRMDTEASFVKNERPHTLSDVDETSSPQAFLFSHKSESASNALLSKYHERTLTIGKIYEDTSLIPSSGKGKASQSSSLPLPSSGIEKNETLVGAEAPPSGSTSSNQDTQYTRAWVEEFNIRYKTHDPENILIPAWRTLNPSLAFPAHDKGIRKEIGYSRRFTVEVHPSRKGWEMAITRDSLGILAPSKMATLSSPTAANPGESGKDRQETYTPPSYHNPK